MDVVFLGAEEPLAARCDGVKLGESTFNRFLLLLLLSIIIDISHSTVIYPLAGLPIQPAKGYRGKCPNLSF